MEYKKGEEYIYTGESNGLYLHTGNKVRIETILTKNKVEVLPILLKVQLLNPYIVEKCFLKK